MTEVLREKKTVQCRSLRAVLIKIQVFLKVKPCRLVKSYYPFRRTCQFHILGLISTWFIIIIIIVIIIVVVIAITVLYSIISHNILTLL